MEEDNQTQAQEKIIYINYFDQIEQERVKFLMAVCTEILEKHKPDTLYFMFASQGGNVEAGIALYNFLKSLPVKIIMHNVGSIDSIANVIFVAGKERYASPHSTFLFHGVKFDFSNPTSFNMNQLNEMMDIVKKSHKKIASIVCENSEMTEVEIEKLFDTGEVKSAEFAVEKKIISEIKVLELPKNASLISINFAPK